MSKENKQIMKLRVSLLFAMILPPSSKRIKRISKVKDFLFDDVNVCSSYHLITNYCIYCLSSYFIKKTFFEKEVLKKRRKRRVLKRLKRLEGGKCSSQSFDKNSIFLGPLFVLLGPKVEWD